MVRSSEQIKRYTVVFCATRIYFVCCGRSFAFNTRRTRRSAHRGSWEFSTGASSCARAETITVRGFVTACRPSWARSPARLAISPRSPAPRSAAPPVRGPGAVISRPAVRSTPAGKTGPGRRPATRTSGACFSGLRSPDVFGLTRED